MLAVLDPKPSAANLAGGYAASQADRWRAGLGAAQAPAGGSEAPEVLRAPRLQFLGNVWGACGFGSKSLANDVTSR